jgi:putative aldouronate transport system permease protein
MSTTTVPRNTAIRMDGTAAVIKLISYVVITLFSIACMLPFVMMATNSFATDASLRAHGFTLWPSAFSTFAYKIVLIDNPSAIVGSYVVTVGLTVIGTFIGLFIIGMTGYALVTGNAKSRTFGNGSAE